MYHASVSKKKDREARMGLKIIRGGQGKPCWYIFEQKSEERIIGVHFFFETLHGLRSYMFTIILNSLGIEFWVGNNFSS